jgi:hypothetical protein
MYLVDQGCSWLIALSSAIGLLIELWKVTRIVKRQGLFNFHLNQPDQKTDLYDKEAMWYLVALICPLMMGYTVYAYMHAQVISHYSFVLQTLVGFVYAFGFVLMTPQLYVNYKLKSVAHMSWRAFTYKALNTVVDDLFAFAIRMPILHRISCFRDDILFLVYLYQRWIYPIDMTRVNEYGQKLEKDK